MKPARLPLHLALSAALVLPACGANRQTEFWPSPLKSQKDAEPPAKTPPEQSEQAPKALTVEETPTPPAPRAAKKKEPAPSPSGKRESADITLTFDQERLPTLIQLIYGKILKKNYTLDPAVASRPDLVTLRTGPQTPAQVEQTARLLLKSYGVAVIDLGGGALRIVPNTNAQGYNPEVRRGRSLPETPLPLRPVFQVLELQAVRNIDVTQWLKMMFGPKLTVTDDPSRNAVMLSGQADDVEAAVEAARLLDQPGMKGRLSVRINPVFMSADEMAKKLIDIMNSEGYSASITGLATGGLAYPVNLVPIAGINAIIAFAADQGILSHILDWARELDTPSSNRAGAGYFTYQALNTDAQRLADTVREALGNPASGTGQAAVPTPATQGAPGSAQTAATTPAVANIARKVVVNAATNTLIFKGNSEEHTQILNLLQELDKPTKAALIELTVAEVDLDANVSLGIDMLSSEMLKQGSFNVLSGGTYGLAIKYLAPGSTTAQDAIHALVTENRAKVLSSPRIMARNGETATIQVGQQVPIVTSQLGTAASSTGTGSSPNLLTAVQYKDVGIILKVKPVIYSGDRIELEVYQEVSDATSTSTGVTTSPTINTKKVETRLALKDGSTVMLGGLISNSQKASEQGVPYLKDIPWLGQLFRTNTTKDVQQELIILITPYTILDDHDAHTITDAFRNQLGSWAYRRDKDAPAGAH